ncbi:uncharacterized protein METZ01_LOCUS319033, partial [marine metagenome]
WARLADFIRRPSKHSLACRERSAL